MTEGRQVVMQEKPPSGQSSDDKNKTTERKFPSIKVRIGSDGSPEDTGESSHCGKNTLNCTTRGASSNASGNSPPEASVHDIPSPPRVKRAMSSPPQNTQSSPPRVKYFGRGDRAKSLLGASRLNLVGKVMDLVSDVQRRKQSGEFKLNQADGSEGGGLFVEFDWRSAKPKNTNNPAMLKKEIARKKFLRIQAAKTKSKKRLEIKDTDVETGIFDETKAASPSTGKGHQNTTFYPRMDPTNGVVFFAHPLGVAEILSQASVRITREQGYSGMFRLFFFAPGVLVDYLMVKYAMTQLVLLVMLDFFDTVSDIFIAMEQKEPQYIALVSIALVLGAWQLVTEVALLCRGRRYITNIAYQQSFGNPTHCRHFTALMAYSRCLSEDGIIMVATVLKGEKITGLNRIWLGISAMFVLYSVLQWAALLIEVCGKVRERRAEGSPINHEFSDSVIIFVILAVFTALWLNFILLFDRSLVPSSDLWRGSLYFAAVCIVLGSLLSLGYGQTWISASNTNGLWWYGPWGKMPHDVPVSAEEIVRSSVYSLKRSIEDFERYNEGCGFHKCCCVAAL